MYIFTLRILKKKIAWPITQIYGKREIIIEQSCKRSLVYSYWMDTLQTKKKKKKVITSKNSMQRKYQMRIGSQPFHHKCFLSHLHGLGAPAQPHSGWSCRVLGMPTWPCRPLEGTAPSDHGRAFHLQGGGLTSRLGGQQRWKHRSSTDKNMSTLKNTRLLGNNVRGSSYWKMRRIQSLLSH